MSIFSSKKSTSSTSTTQSDERVAASDFANVIRAEEGSTINFGVSGADLTAALGLRDSGKFEAERRAVAETIAGSGGAAGTNNFILLAGLGLAALVLLGMRS